MKYWKEFIVTCILSLVGLLIITFFIFRDFTRQRQKMLIEEKFGVVLIDLDDFHHESCEIGPGLLDEARGDVFRINYNFY